MSPSPPEIVDSFGSTVEVLNYLWNTQTQKMMDSNVVWKFLQDRGHIEFYQFGPDLAAVPIYDMKNWNRLELLIVGRLMPVAQIHLAIDEMLKMIRRKKIGPVTRRIKED